VLKSPEPWKRTPGPALGGTTIVRSSEALRALTAEWPAMPPVAVQEYLPEERCQDWIVHAYCDERGTCLVDFTGMKLRSMPREAGPTAFACTVRNEELAALASDFCKRIGFCGVADLDWRFDELDGAYKLLDFNPRMGAQFRLFETESGVDVVRAMHLDLTRRPVPAGRQIDGRRIVVENLDAMATLTYRRNGGTRPAPVARTGTELAWLALDDPLPALVMTARVVGPAAARRMRKVAMRPGQRGSGESPGP
jgi:predicted ATP-grasp superfamily ATP-dependent carboligase